MADKKYKLTISILASNRKDTLPKTLESIKPILENVSSELIITDTGCDDELLDVIKGYTDKIVKFQWCNDFSKARNVGLKLAQGEWFMFIDDDEWFEDVGEIVGFFNSGEEKKYNTFNYRVRNYRNLEGTLWQDGIVDRGIRLAEDIEFEDSVHEHYSKKPKPTILLDVYAHHYGYVFENEELRRKHAKRNLELIGQQMRAGNKSLRTYLHLLQEYNSLEMNEEAYEKALEAISYAYENKLEDVRMLSCIKVNAVYSLFKMSRDDELISKAEGYLNEDKLTSSAKCGLYAYMTYAYCGKNDLKQTIRSVQEYFRLRESLDKDENARDYESLLAISLIYTGTIPDKIFNMGLSAAIALKDEAAVINIMNSVKYVEELTYPLEADWLQKLTKMLTDSTVKAQFAGAMSNYIERLQNIR